MFLIVVIAGAAALSHVVPFPFLLELFSGGVSVWRVPRDGARTIYLTFDDGPNPAATPELLDLLKEKNVRATFFVIDEYVDESTAPLIQRMFAEGHMVGQHTGDRWLMLRGPGSVASTLQTAAGNVQSLTGRRPCPIFRPHAGWRSVSMLRGTSRSGYRLVGWSWMTWDWVWFHRRTGPRVARQVIRHAAPGKIVVIHDGHHRNPRADRRYAIDATRRIIEDLSEKGYEFRTICSGLR